MVVCFSNLFFGYDSLLLRLKSLCWMVMSRLWMFLGSGLVSSRLRLELSLLILFMVCMCRWFLGMWLLLERLVVLLLLVCVVICESWLFMGC